MNKFYRSVIEGSAPFYPISYYIDSFHIPQVDEILGQSDLLAKAFLGDRLL